MSARVLPWMLLVGCQGASLPPPSEAQTSQKAPSVEVVAVKEQVLHSQLPLVGELTPYEAVAIYPRVQGFVDEVRVDRGTLVKAGQLLAHLAAPELASQRMEAQSKALSDQSTLERLRAASGTPGAVAGHDLEIAQAAVDGAQAHARSLQTLESYLTIKAPFDGVVTERNVHPGALVGPPSGPSNPPLFRVEQVRRLRLTVAVPEADVGPIAQGESVEFKVRAWPGERFSGSIQRVAHSVDPKTRTMPVELDVDNQAGRLAPGMFADVSWPLHRSGPSLLVPPAAVVQGPEKTFVDRVEDGILKQVAVQRGVATPEGLEVFGALKAGDWVLARASEELHDGVHVEAHSPAPNGKAQ